MTPAVIDRVLAMVVERVFWQAVCAERARVAQDHAALCDAMASGADRFDMGLVARQQAKISRYEAADLRRWAAESEGSRFL